ncbi:hypothetical protein L1049_010247 [Liquidambar formosana]|uniref:Uncharacterized protein n=1 Tax=Liquidambar formosana TaxID=63359 RepID=A0AAP0R6X2_LIQFO
MFGFVGGDFLEDLEALFSANGGGDAGELGEDFDETALAGEEGFVDGSEDDGGGGGDVALDRSFLPVAASATASAVFMDFVGVFLMILDTISWLFLLLFRQNRERQRDRDRGS